MGGADKLRAAMLKMRTLEAFKEVLQALEAGEEIDMWGSVMLLAKHRYPDLDEQKYVDILDEWGEAIELRLKGRERYPMVVLKTVSAFLYKELGFTGNKLDYYHPDNSCLNRVIETRTGIPITMSLVFMELARRVGLSMHGVNLPSHFLLRPDSDELAVFVDAYDDGQIIFLEDAEEMLGKSWGVDVKLDPVWIERNEALPPMRVLTRVLFNLKNVYSLNQKPAELLTIIKYIREALPDNTSEVRNEGMCLFALERYVESIDALVEYLDSAPEAEDADEVRQVIREAQSLVNKGA